jgi:hypothetical protein
MQQQIPVWQNRGLFLFFTALFTAAKYRRNLMAEIKN